MENRKGINMTFFDCVYLKVSKFYSSAEKEELSGYSGLFVLTLMHFFNISALFFIICIILQVNPPLPTWAFLLLAGALLFANGAKYYSIDFSILQEKWQGIAEEKRNRLNRLVSIYIVGSTTVCLILLIYIGGRKF
jgi:hypothetical protein